MLVDALHFMAFVSIDFQSCASIPQTACDEDALKSHKIDFIVSATFSARFNHFSEKIIKEISLIFY